MLCAQKKALSAPFLSSLQPSAGWVLPGMSAAVRRHLSVFRTVPADHPRWATALEHTKWSAIFLQSSFLGWITNIKVNIFSCFDIYLEWTRVGTIIHHRKNTTTFTPWLGHVFRSECLNFPPMCNGFIFVPLKCPRHSRRTEIEKGGHLSTHQTTRLLFRGKVNITVRPIQCRSKRQWGVLSCAQCVCSRSSICIARHIVLLYHCSFFGAARLFLAWNQTWDAFAMTWICSSHANYLIHGLGFMFCGSTR